MKRLLRFIGYGVFILVLLEGASQIGIKIITGRWLFEAQTYCYQELFQRHPWLVATTRPNAHCTNGKVTFSTNSLGFRGKDFALSKPEGVKRIVCYGGSSTFCTQVSDEETWPYYLQEALGQVGYQVVNAGFPGYSSAEAIIQTALQQFDLSPDICLYYEGWNDLRNMHIKNLKSDYSDFHGPSQITNQRLDGWLISNRLALAQLIRILSSQKATRPEGALSSSMDDRALEIYKYNLRTLIAICKARNIKIIMVPQVLNYKKLSSQKPYNWAPLVRQKDVMGFMRIYNQAMIDVCARENVLCLEKVLDTEWADDDFIDEGHFSAKGNNKFAVILAEGITAQTK